MSDKDGLEKNLDVVGGEWEATWPRIKRAFKIAISDMKEAEGIYQTLHKFVNVFTETYRATGITIPRTLAYISIIIIVLVFAFLSYKVIASDLYDNIERF
jgi:hypothetical protein